MLTRGELDLVQGQLASALSVGDPKNSITAYFGSAAGDILLKLPTNLTTYDEYAVYVIDYCVRSRWIETPSLMEKLLSKLLAGGVSHGTAELEAALARVKLRQDPNERFYSTYWVLREQPFLNRQSLRPLLRRFIESSDRALMRIGGPGAGKSYTGELLDYLASLSNELHFVPVRLNDKEGPTYTVESLAGYLLSPMGLGVPESSSSCDAGALCRLILRSTARQLGLWIFVLDGFGQPDLQPEVKELLRLLISNCSGTNDYRRKMRFVLINYSEPLADIMPAAIVDDMIPLPSVCKQDLIDCLMQLNELRRQQGRPTLDGLDTIAAGMLAGAPPAGDKERLRYLYDGLMALATV
jgi:hypothetical protein